MNMRTDKEQFVFHLKTALQQYGRIKLNLEGNYLNIALYLDDEVVLSESVYLPLNNEDEW